MEECNRVGLRTTAYFVVGLPGETKDAMKRSMRFAERLPVDSVGISIATPYPGTPLWDICEKNGYFVDGFTRDNLYTGVCQIRTPDFEPGDVERLVSKTLIRRAFRHPSGTLLRLSYKFLARSQEHDSFRVQGLHEGSASSTRCQKFGPIACGTRQQTTIRQFDE